MGRPPVPTALKVLRGTAAHNPQRLNPAEPRPPIGAKPPPWLPTTGPARQAWRRLARVLTATRVLTVADAEALGLVCMAAAEYLEAVAEPNGWRHADAAAKRYAAGLASFGLTPVSRSRVAAVPIVERDPLAEWMADTPADDPPPPPRPRRRKAASPPADPFEAWETR